MSPRFGWEHCRTLTLAAAFRVSAAADFRAAAAASAMARLLVVRLAVCGPATGDRVVLLPDHLADRRSAAQSFWSLRRDDFGPLPLLSCPIPPPHPGCMASALTLNHTSSTSYHTVRARDSGMPSASGHTLALTPSRWRQSRRRRILAAPRSD